MNAYGSVVITVILGMIFSVLLSPTDAQFQKLTFVKIVGRHEIVFLMSHIIILHLIK